jgi:hypothetical protein
MMPCASAGLAAKAKKIRRLKQRQAAICRQRIKGVSSKIQFDGRALKGRSRLLERPREGFLREESKS